MKTKVFYLSTKITVAVILVAVLVSRVMAADAPKLKFVPYSNDRAVVSLNNEASVTTKLTIENVSGDVVFYNDGSISEKVYSKVFDFKNLNDGEYKITASNKYVKNTMFFKVENNAIVENGTEPVSPFVEVKDDVLKISLLNHKLNNVEVSVYSQDGEVFTRSLCKDFSINAGFNLGRLESGDYAINITDGEKLYSYNFNK